MIPRYTTLPIDQWLRGLRACTEQNQQQMADTVGVHRVTYVRWETGKAYPNRDARLRLNEIARDAGYEAIPPKRRHRR